MRRGCLWCVCSITCAAVLLAQPRVDPASVYERLICIVPMVGRGTPEDPRRPMFVPAPREAERTAREGILAFSYQLSDDGQFALVEFVARSRAGFDLILKSARSDVKAFVRGEARKEEIEREFRRYKRDFRLDQFPRVAAP